MTALYFNTKVSLFLSMASATPLAVLKSSALSTTRLTRPHLSAVCASKGAAVSESSRALYGPIARDNLWDNPQDGKIPNLQER